MLLLGHFLLRSISPGSDSLQLNTNPVDPILIALESQLNDLASQFAKLSSQCSEYVLTRVPLRRVFQRPCILRVHRM
jgi:hypothetical protein